MADEIEDDDVVVEGDEEFGSCCSELREAMSGNEFEPLIVVGEDEGDLDLLGHRGGQGGKRYADRQHAGTENGFHESLQGYVGF